jgi:hypothetical protein
VVVAIKFVAIDGNPCSVSLDFFIYYLTNYLVFIIFVIYFLTRQLGALVGLTFIRLSSYRALSLILLAQIPSCLIIKRGCAYFYNPSPLLLGSAAASSSSLRT